MENQDRLHNYWQQPYRTTLQHLTLTSSTTTSALNTFENGRRVVQCLRLQQHRARTLSYVITEDKLHWIMELKANLSKDKLAQQLKSQITHQLRIPSKSLADFWLPSYQYQRIADQTQAIQITRALLIELIHCRVTRSIKTYPHWDACWLNS